MGENLTRRTVLRGAGAVGAVAASAASLAACGSSTSSSSATTGATSGASATSGATSATTTGGATATGSASASGTKVAKADVPVNGGKIVGGIVVTQPASGTYKAFSSTCTHQGCTVDSVANNKIVCPCHGSGFDASTGAVVNGPATRALSAKTLADSGDSVVVA
ncbi:MAG: Rieske (2Fe-2S) protein [Dermatophilaceae bacterium]